MFAPDVYFTFRGMSEGSSDGLYRGDSETNHSFPYNMYRGKEYDISELERLISEFNKNSFLKDQLVQKTAEYMIEKLKPMKMFAYHDFNLFNNPDQKFKYLTLEEMKNIHNEVTLQGTNDDGEVVNFTEKYDLEFLRKVKDTLKGIFESYIRNHYIQDWLQNFPEKEDSFTPLTEALNGFKEDLFKKSINQIQLLSERLTIEEEVVGIDLLAVINDLLDRGITNIALAIQQNIEQYEKLMTYNMNY